MSNCLPMMLLCFQYFLIRLKQQIYWMSTLIKFDDGLNSGEWLLILIQLNKLKKSFFQKNLRNLSIQISIRTVANSVFSVADIYGIKLLTRLRVGLSNLREQKFRQNFQDTINPLCSESTSHFFCAAKISSPQEPHEFISWMNSVNLILIFLI